MVGEFFTSVFGDSNMVVNIFQNIMEDGNMVGDFIGAIACIVGVICGIAMWLKINEDL